MAAMRDDATRSQAYVVAGPTSGIGFHTALALAKHGAMILVGRDRTKLDHVQTLIERGGGRAVSVRSDLSDPASAKRAAEEISALPFSLVGLVNNAGIMQMGEQTKSALGWNLSFATNHVGPFALTEALIAHMPDAANVVFVVSAVEDPGRKPAV